MENCHSDVMVFGYSTSIWIYNVHDLYRPKKTSIPLARFLNLLLLWIYLWKRVQIPCNTVKRQNRWPAYKIVTLFNHFLCGKIVLLSCSTVLFLKMVLRCMVTVIFTNYFGQFIPCFSIHFFFFRKWCTAVVSLV
jgi:hypothetical protein